MTTPTPSQTPEMDLLRQFARMSQRVLRLQLEGLTQADSLIAPTPGGNCLNWVVGHLLDVYGRMLALLGQPPVLPDGALARYERGSAPLAAESEALELPRLLEAWDESSRRVDAGLAAVSAARLAEPAPSSPSGNPHETIGSLLATITWHQAYHVGQVALLRRLAGKPGAIR